MKLIVNNDLSDIYYNYKNDNFKQIVIKGDNNRYSIELVKKNRFNKPTINNRFISKMSTYNLINLIVSDFLSKKIESCEKNFFEGNNSLNFENNKGQNVSIYSSNIIKNFPLILDSYDKIDIVDNDIYDMINNNLVKKIEVHYYELSYSCSKNISYFMKPGLLKIIITGDLENTKEIKDLINYYKEINGNNKKIDVIDFKSNHHKQIITFDNNSEIYINGKEMIDYLERGKVYGKVINGKISKFM